MIQAVECRATAPGEFAAAVEGCQISMDALLCRDGGDLQHPGGGIGCLRDGLHPRNGLKVGHHALALEAQRPIVDDLPAPLQQQHLIECLSHPHTVLIGALSLWGPRSCLINPLDSTERGMGSVSRI